VAGHMHLGLELDGTRATVCTMQDGTVAKVEQFDGDSPADALGQALAATRRQDPVRVLLLTDGILLRRVDLTADHLTREAFTDLAYKATGAPREGTEVAGLFFDTDAVKAGILGSGVAVVAPAGPIHELRDLLRPHPVEVVAPPLTAGGLEGLSLALRHSGAELTLVVDGEPVAYRQLPAGGLAGVEARLGTGAAVGGARLHAALNGNPAQDPMATVELERYLRRVLTEARETIETWARQGERAGRDLFVYGPGAAAPQVDVLLRDLGLGRAEQPHVNDALVRLAPRRRLEVVGAYLAAVTYGHGLPQAPFPDPQEVATARARASRAHTGRRRSLAARCAAVILAGAVLPVTAGAVVHHLAGEQLTQALAGAGVDQPDGQDHLTRVGLARQLTDPVDWQDTLTAIHAATPADLTLTSIHLAHPTGGTGVQVSLTGTSKTGPTGVQDLTAALVAKGGATHVSTEQITWAGNDKAQFTVTFTMPGGAR